MSVGLAGCERKSTVTSQYLRFPHFNLLVASTVRPCLFRAPSFHHQIPKASVFWLAITIIFHRPIINHIISTNNKTTNNDGEDD
jgi:hypothetical protein